MFPARFPSLERFAAMIAFALAHAHALALIPIVLGGIVAVLVLADCFVCLYRIFR